MPSSSVSRREPRSSHSCTNSSSAGPYATMQESTVRQSARGHSSSMPSFHSCRATAPTIALASCGSLELKYSSRTRANESGPSAAASTSAVANWSAFRQNSTASSTRPYLRCLASSSAPVTLNARAATLSVHAVTSHSASAPAQSRSIFSISARGRRSPTTFRSCHSTRSASVTLSSAHRPHTRAINPTAASGSASTITW
mmetsp:Transcript_19852/g.59317  ORF Transcript_19852/g.59317 Transcript_19852/m.59317 type:complete len:200 (+) Transcript_19852:1556-2155(+)